jgi:hypothetical protein
MYQSCSFRQLAATARHRSFRNGVEVFLLKVPRQILSWKSFQRHFRGPLPRRPGEVLESGASKVTQFFLERPVKLARPA